MKTVLVTGAQGYIGKHVVQALETLSAKIIAVDRADAPCRKGNTTSIQCDIFNDTWDMLESIGPVDACLHLAWRNGFVHNDPSHMLDVSAHYQFLHNLIVAGIPQIAVMGTMHEIGFWEGVVCDDTPCNPQSLYGIAKNTLRQSSFLEVRESDVKLQWLRGFYIYGDDENSQSVFGKLYRAAAGGATTFPFTSGEKKYDFIHIQEFARQIAASVMQDKVVGIINCCSGKAISLGEQVESYIAQQGLNITLDYGVYPDRTYDSAAIWGDDTNIQAILSDSDIQIKV